MEGVFLANGAIARSSSLARRSAMSWSRIAVNLQALGAHSFLLCFTCLIIVKVTSYFYVSWWYVTFEVSPTYCFILFLRWVCGFM